MTNKSKIKGSTFERDIVTLLNENVKNSTWKRVPMSGAIGTALSEPLLGGDLFGKVYGVQQEFRGECKTGYNRSSEQKQFTLKKEWLDKIAEEARNSYAMPILFGKFENTRVGTKTFAVMDTRVLIALLNRISELKSKIEEGE